MVSVIESISSVMSVTLVWSFSVSMFLLSFCLLFISFLANFGIVSFFLVDLSLFFGSRMLVSLCISALNLL